VELGQVAIVVFIIFVVDNKDTIAIVIVFEACCCCSRRPWRMMMMRQEWQQWRQHGMMVCGGTMVAAAAASTQLSLAPSLIVTLTKIACSGTCSRGQVLTTPLPLCGRGNTHVLTHHAHINCVLEILIGQPAKQIIARCLFYLVICLVGKKVCIDGDDPENL
jgi:hypothetical protein